MENVHQTLYEIIGVPRNASRQEIEAACIRLGDKYRPDNNPGDPVARKAFSDIEFAYEILSDASKRSRYDAGLLEASVKNEMNFRSEPRYEPNPRYDSAHAERNLSFSKILGVLGSLVLFVGVFAPLVSVPLVGNMNYFQNGRGDGSIILVLAVTSIVLSAVGRFKWLYLTGFSRLGILIFTFVNFQIKISQMKTEMDTRLAGNPFKGIADVAMSAFQLQWGWALLIIGIGLVLSSAAFDQICGLTQRRK